MRILLVHNAYLQRGGEDAVYEAERDLLRQNGHEVHEYRVDNEGVDRMSQLALASAAIFGRTARRRIAELVKEHEIEIAHFHNTQPQISPASFRAARRAGAAVVHTLHNYRIACPSATLFRDGQPCEDCVGRTFATPAIRNRCYRNSRAASAVVALGTGLHRVLGTWRRDVDRYVALTEFQREVLVRAGLPAERVTILPNFLATDPGRFADGGRNGILFVGRLTEEKGVRTLLAALRHLPKNVSLRVVGSGPLGSEVAIAAAADPRLVAVGVRSTEQVHEEMRRAAVLAVPSLWYEGMPMTIVEAFSCGLPVVCSAIGGLPSLVEDGVNGRLVEAGDPRALADALLMVSGERALRGRLSAGARQSFLTRFTADAHHNRLLEVYGAALRVRHGKGGNATTESDATPSLDVPAEPVTPVHGSS